MVYNMRPEVSAVFKEGESVTRLAGSPRRAPMHAGDAGDADALASLAFGLRFPDGRLPLRVKYDGKDDGGLPHAPKRPVRLTPELRRKVSEQRRECVCRVRLHARALCPEPAGFTACE